MAKSDYKIKGGKSKIIINPDKEKLKEAVMRAREKAREAILKQKYDDTSMKADMRDRYGSEKGEKIYYATIRKKAMSKKDKMEEVEFAGNYEGPLYAPHPALVQERGDFWHPDPEQDRKLGGPGANQRAREDRAGASKPKPKSSNTTKPGESYMDYAKRKKEEASKSSSKPKYSPEFQARLDKARAKKKEGIVGKLKRKLGLKKEGYAPGDVDQKVGAVTAIPKKEQDAARARLLAKAAAKRKAMKKESIQIPSFGEFIAEGKGSPEALASLEKVKARQKVLDDFEKKTGKKGDITKTPEHKAHKKNFPGAKRTGKKVPGKKETDLETHNRRVNRNVSRIVKHGYTSKEKKEVQSMAKHASRYD